jgi:hypothetical protein
MSFTTGATADIGPTAGRSKADHSRTADVQFVPGAQLLGNVAAAQSK